MSAPTVSMPWTKGTEHRDDATGIYTFPHPAIASPTREHFVSVTTVLDSVCGSELVYVHNWYVAKAASDLLALSREGRKAIRWEEHPDPQTGELTWEQSEVDPILLLQDTHYLKNEGFRMMKKAADRGSTAHDLLEMYGLGMPLPEGEAELSEWAEMIIFGSKRSCSVDEVVPYLVSLSDWLQAEQPEVLLCEAPVFNRSFGYAGTLDMVMKWRGRTWTADLKTSKSTRKSHAMQIAAYRNAEFYAVKGTATEAEIPASDGTLILLCQPGGVTPREWENPEGAFEAFVHALMPWYFANSSELPVTIERPKTKMPAPERAARAALDSTPIKQRIRECPFGQEVSGAR